MLVDLLSSDNYKSYNIKIAKMLGLETAVYIAEILDIYNRACIEAGKSVDYIEIDPSVITEKTTIEDTVQSDIRSRLDNLDILKPKVAETFEDVNMFRFDYKVLVALITTDDEDLMSKIVKVSVKPSARESERRKKINNLKLSIICNNGELRQAFYDWIDACFSTKNGYLSIRAIKVFQQELDKYAKGDLDLALKLIDIAVVKKYTDMTFVIKYFETYQKKDYMKQHKKINTIQTSGVGRKQSISSEVF